MKESINKKGIVFIITLTAILVFVLTVGFIRDNMVQRKNNKDYSEWLEDENNKKDDKNSNKSNSLLGEKIEDGASNNEPVNIYSKMKSKQDINMVVFGDGLALSLGRNTQDGIWQNALDKSIESGTDSKVQITSLAKNKSSTKEGLTAVNNFKDMAKYDAVILCFGHNDSMIGMPIKDFEKNYNDIVSRIKSQNNNIVIMAVIPNTLPKGNRYRDSLIKICADNKIIIGDMYEAFNETDSTLKTLTKDSLPNDAGYKLYAKTLYNSLVSNIK